LCDRALIDPFLIVICIMVINEELDGPAVCALGERGSLATLSKVSHRMGDSEGTLSRWSRLHLQSLAPAPASRWVDVRQAGRKNNCPNKNVPSPLSGIRVRRRRFVLWLYKFRSIY
jgi:hypothetical protein